MTTVLCPEAASAQRDELRRENHLQRVACEVCGLYAEPPNRLCEDCEKQFGDEAIFMQDSDDSRNYPETINHAA